MFGYALIFIVVLIILSGLFVVKQQTYALIERFGKFTSVRGPGLQLKIPVIDQVAGRVSIRIQQLDVVVETKTKDDVFVHLKISVQFQILKDNVYDAFYKLQNPTNKLPLLYLT